MKKAKSQKLVVVILCAVVFGVVFYQFSWQARASTLSHASVVRAVTASKQGELAAGKKAKEQEAANRDALVAVQAGLPATVDAQGVIRQLTQLAVASQVNWDNVTLGAPTATAIGGLQAVPITISISGTMANVQAYLVSVRSAAASRIMTVDSVATTFSVDKDTLAESVVALLSMKTFVYAIDSSLIATTTTVAAADAGTNTVTKTPVGTVPSAVIDPTNVGATTTTTAFTG
jgi:Tfp pilus assembly protein PilO